MGILGNTLNLNPGQFNDPLERHINAPLSRYGTTHPVDKALWGVDRAKEVVDTLKSKRVKPHEILAGVTAAQGRGGKGSNASTNI